MLAMSQTSPSLMMRWHRAVRAVIAIVTVGCFLAACSEGSDGGDDKASRPYRSARTAPVVTFPAVIERLEESVEAVGTARALRSVDLYPESAGIVRAVNFKANQAVAAGDVLLALDARDEQLAVELAEIALLDAERAVKRFESVNRQNTNIAESQIDTAKATVDSARVALQQAQVALDRRHIKAPFDGWAGITDIDVGDRIDTSTMVTSLDDRSQLLVNFSVPEVFVGQVIPGTPVNAKLWDSSGTVFTGEIVAVDSRVSPSSRAFTARAAIDNQDDSFRPGMAFEIAVNVSRGQFLAVPDVAVQWGADGPYVWIAEDAKAVRRDVLLVKRLPNRLLLTGDIEPGTLVIAEGVQAMREGIALNILDADQLDRDVRQELNTGNAAPADTTDDN